MKKTINGVTYYYEWLSTYHPEQPTILCLHGFTGTSQTFAQTFPISFGEQYNVLAVDLLGHGQTDVFVHPYRYQMISMCNDLVDLTETLDLSSFSLIGYSMGARVALALAVLFPWKIEQLFLESGSPGLADVQASRRRQQSDQQLAGQLLTQGIHSFVEQWEQAPLFATQTRLSPTLQARIRQERLSQQPFGLACSLWYMGTGVQPAFWNDLPELQTKTTIIVGALDQKFVQIAKQMKQQQSALTLAVIPDAGHCVHLEKPTAFFTYIQEGLAKE